MSNTPILLIVFNRPDTTQRVFDVIKQQKPNNLFVAADGPRKNKPDDIIKCHAARNILNQVDWKCELKTLFRDSNMGCGKGPADGITWFFDHVEQGIILEDDCLPDQSFFPFCEELLHRFRYDNKISVISGTNPLLKWKEKKCSYVYSKIGGTWGWATWRRAWKNFDYTATLWKAAQGKERVNKTLNNKLFYSHFSQEFDTYFRCQRNDVWDFQWLFSRLVHSTYSIVPCRNLISNIGFNEYATHTLKSSDPMAGLCTYKINFPLKHTEFKIDRLYDRIVFERFINPKKRTIIKRILIKIIKIITSTN
jgi:hypothetical protein